MRIFHFYDKSTKLQDDAFEFVTTVRFDNFINDIQKENLEFLKDNNYKIDVNLSKLQPYESERLFDNFLFDKLFDEQKMQLFVNMFDSKEKMRKVILEVIDIFKETDIFDYCLPSIFLYVR